MNKLVAIVGGSTLVYAGLALLMGVLPGIELSATPPGPGVTPLTPLQAQGRDVYVANGCGYCHTQQVRPLQQDKAFGRPSAPGDFAYQTPELLGSERTGPDLTNIGVRNPSAVWQYIHLYNPRAVVPESIMPRFPWLFQAVLEVPPGATPVPLPTGFTPPMGKLIPTQQAKALVAYLQSLRQPALPSATPTTAVAPAAPSAAPLSAADRGHALFVTNCALCHQANGGGLPGAFPSLIGNAAVNNPDPTLHIHTVLYGAHGVVIDGVTYASPMPPFAPMLSNSDIADIINHERSSWGNHGKPVTAAQVAAARAKGP